MPHLTFRNLPLIATFASIWFSAALADQVVLKNGDRVTGNIVKKDAKGLTIKTDHFGIVTTTWDQVASLSADKPVTVVLQDGRTLKGTLSTADGKVEVSEENALVSVPPGEITAMRNSDEQRAYDRMIRPGLLELWNGNASIGFAGTIGNARTSTLATTFNASRTTHEDKASIYFRTINATALVNGRNSETAQAVRAGLAYDHNLGSKFFLNAFNDWEHDRFQNLDLRFVVGSGVGYHAWMNDRSRLDLLAGFDYNHSSFSTPAARNSTELFWGDDYNVRLNSVTSIVQGYRMFNNLNSNSTYRVNGDLSVATKIKRWLTWNVSLSDRYLSTPAPGRKKNDLLYTTGFGVTFSR